MRFASALSAGNRPEELIEYLAAQIHAGLGDTSIDLLLVFLTVNLQPATDNLLQGIRSALHPRMLLATTAESVCGAISSGRGAAVEVERQPALAALAMSLPGVTVKSFHLAEEDWPEVLTDPQSLREHIGAGDTVRTLLMLGDPFSTPIVQLLGVCSQVFPRAPVIGGMASGMQAAGEARLAMNQRIYSQGLVGVALEGNIQVDAVVSQGCRPIGDTFVITKGHQNVIEELNGQPALAAIQELIANLPPDDRKLLETHGLPVGRVIDEGKGHYGKGDFLIRQVIQADRDSGAITINDYARTGQTLQFHVRDQRTADEDLRLLLEGELQLAKAPLAALLFTCAGRGTRLFPQPHHDMQAVQTGLGRIPTAGFFAAGEIGPVGQRNFVHSFTASLALFRDVEA